MADETTRREIHHRSIDFRGYCRSDGLWEVEGRVTDVKADPFETPGNGRIVPAGKPIHNISVTLVFDGAMVVREVQTSMDSYPYMSCPGGGDSLQALVGLSIGAGWNGEIRKRLPVCDTCTHLREILAPMATAAYQTMTEKRRHLLHETDDAGYPRKIDSCHAYGRSRALVASLWPEHAKRD